MQQATRLTATRHLTAATAAIQEALQSAGQRVATAAPGAQPGLVIDVDARDAVPANDASRAPGQDDRFVAGQSHGYDYKLYIPPSSTGRQHPLVVMLHGCTQDPDDFAAGTRMNEAAREAGCFVLYPAQSSQANPQRCWNWFKHSHQARGRGEPAMLARMTQDILERHPVDPRRVYIAGLSAGGAMAAITADAYPELFAAVGVHSGLATGAARDLPSALGAMRSGGGPVPGTAAGRPTIVFHGDADSTVHPSNGDSVLAASAGVDAKPEETQARAGSGRRYTRRVYRDAKGVVVSEHWIVHGSGHAWSGGSSAGSYTDGQGPDATAQMLQFFLAQ